MSDAFRTSNSEESVEHFLSEAISNSPQPLKDLAEFLSNALSEDDWKTADRLLLALALRNRTSEPEACEGEAVAWRKQVWVADGIGTGWMLSNQKPEPNNQPTEIEPLYTHPAPSESDDRLREAMKSACDLLAERKYGHAARSPGHNARLVLEAALSPKEGGK